VRNITADSSVLHAVEHEDIWIYFFFRELKTHILYTKSAVRSRTIDIIK